MLQESPVAPHVWLLVSNAITGILTFAGTLIGLRFKQKREHADVAKTRAEARSLHVSSDISLSRELQAVVDKAESRRDEWHAKEEQMRTQILFWRNKAEEFDGHLIDSRDANVQLQARLKIKQDALDKCMVLMALNKVKFEEADHPEVKKTIERITLYLKTENLKE